MSLLTNTQRTQLNEQLSQPPRRRSRRFRPQPDLYGTSLSHEIAVCRERLQLSQLHLSRLLKVKLHRLSDLEKARSLATPLEELRLRQRLQYLQSHARETAKLLLDPQSA